MIENFKRWANSFYLGWRFASLVRRSRKTIMCKGDGIWSLQERWDEEKREEKRLVFDSRSIVFKRRGIFTLPDPYLDVDYYQQVREIATKFKESV